MTSQPGAAPPPSAASRPHLTAEELQRRRYGRTPAAGGSMRRLPWVVAAVVAVVITAVVVWLTIAQRSPVATASVTSYQVVGPAEVTVSLSVHRPDPAVAVTCAVVAQDASRAQVGVSVVEVAPATTSPTTVAATIVTLAPAELAIALDNGCLAAD